MYKEITITGVKDLLPGDWVYFKNLRITGSNIPAVPGVASTMYLGNGKFRGFGVGEESDADLNKKLLEAYNTGLPLADQKAFVPGMQNYAPRPVISEVEKTGP